MTQSDKRNKIKRVFCRSVWCESSIIEVIFRSSQLLFCISNISVTLSQQDYTQLKLSLVWMQKHLLAFRWEDPFRKTQKYSRQVSVLLERCELTRGNDKCNVRCSTETDEFLVVLQLDNLYRCGVWTWLGLVIGLKVERLVRELNRFFCSCFGTRERNICHMFLWDVKKVLDSGQQDWC